MSSYVEDNIKPDYDSVMVDIVDYVRNTPITSELALDTARLCLMDTLGCGLLALNFAECVKMMGPVVPGAEMTDGRCV